MHSKIRYSFFAFLISALLHAGLFGFVVNYKEDEKPKPPKKMTLQVAMFKEVITPPPIVKPEPVVMPAAPPVVNKPKPVAKKVMKKVVKKKPKKVVKKKPPPKKVPVKVVQKQVVKQRPIVKPLRNHRPPPVQPRRHPPVASKPKPRTNPTPATKRPLTQQRPAARPTHNPQLEQQYARSITQSIEQQKSYPRRAKRMHQQGVVKVGFTLNKSGIISNLRIVQSSGSTHLDNATLQAVKKVGRFPAFPKGVNKSSLRYVIPIAYRLN